MPNSIENAAPDNRGMLALGHAISTAFHVTALYLDATYLLLTIPVHLIYAAVAFARHDAALANHISRQKAAAGEKSPIYES